MPRFCVKFGSAILFIIVVLSGPHVMSQDAGRSEGTWNNGIGHSAWSLALEPEDRKRMLSLWELVGEDLKTENTDLAGTFFQGSYNAGYFLRWSPARGFVVIPYFDQNLITDYGYGKVTVVDETDVIFTPEKELGGGRGLDKIPRRWTTVLGLFVPVEMLGDFGNYRAGLGVYNEFNGRCCEFAPAFLVGRIDRLDKPLSRGIPPRYKRFIKEPITTKIVLQEKREWCGIGGTRENFTGSGWQKLSSLR